MANQPTRHYQPPRFLHLLYANPADLDPGHGNDAIIELIVDTNEEIPEPELPSILDRAPRVKKVTMKSSDGGYYYGSMVDSGILVKQKTMWYNFAAAVRLSPLINITTLSLDFKATRHFLGVATIFAKESRITDLSVSFNSTNKPSAAGLSALVQLLSNSTCSIENLTIVFGDLNALEDIMNCFMLRGGRHPSPNLEHLTIKQDLSSTRTLPQFPILGYNLDVIALFRNVHELTFASLVLGEASQENLVDFLLSRQCWGKTGVCLDSLYYGRKENRIDGSKMVVERLEQKLEAQNTSRIYKIISNCHLPTSCQHVYVQFPWISPFTRGFMPQWSLPVLRVNEAASKWKTFISKVGTSFNESRLTKDGEWDVDKQVLTLKLAVTREIICPLLLHKNGGDKSGGNKSGNKNDEDYSGRDGNHGDDMDGNNAQVEVEDRPAKKQKTNNAK